MEEVEVVLPVMPAAVAAMGLLCSLGLLVKIWKDTDNIYVRFVATAIWARYLASEFPSITFTSVGGFSIISLVSLATVASGVLLVGPRGLSIRLMLPIYAVIIVTVIGGVLTGGFGGAVDASIKWMYFAALVGATLAALRTAGMQDTSMALLLAIAAPVAFQLLGIPFGFFKASEADGSASAIGGYGHESAFSIVSLTMILIAGLVMVENKGARKLFFFLGLASLVLANYRTAMLGGIPLIIVASIFTTIGSVRPDTRPVVVAIMAPAILLVCLGASAFADRFADLFTAISEADRLMVPPDYYSWADRQIMSARPYIWSQYITTYIHGSDINILFGYGANSWSRFFTVYAHNTFVGGLFETGMFGLMALMFLMISFTVMAFRARTMRSRVLLVSVHVGFFLLNLSTMPLWNIEGLIFYALAVAYTKYIADGYRSPTAAVPEAQAPHPRAIYHPANGRGVRPLPRRR